MHRPGRAPLHWLLALLVTISGCASSPSTSSTIIKTLQEVGDSAPFSNVLVISVAGEFPTRVRFEQALTTALSSDEAMATAFYTVVGRRAALTRKVLSDAVSVREFDAIILTRLKGQDRADLVMNRPTGHRFNLYLYDYEELNIPAPIQTTSTVSFVVEVYDARARKKIWSIESLLFNADSVDSVVSHQVAAIAAEIAKDGLMDL